MQPDYISERTQFLKEIRKMDNGNEGREEINIFFPVGMLKVKPRYSSLGIRGKEMNRVLFNKMGRERISKEVTFDQRLERSEGLSKDDPGERTEATKALKCLLGITWRSVGLKLKKRKSVSESRPENGGSFSSWWSLGSHGRVFEKERDGI